MGGIDVMADEAALVDGRAFHLAADQMGEMEKERRLFGISTGDPGFDPVAGLLMHYVLENIRQWPKAAAAVAAHAWRHPEASRKEIAREFGVSRQAVSKSLQRSNLDRIRDSCLHLGRWLRSC